MILLNFLIWPVFLGMSYHTDYIQDLGSAYCCVGKQQEQLYQLYTILQNLSEYTKSSVYHQGKKSESHFWGFWERSWLWPLLASQPFTDFMLTSIEWFYHLMKSCQGFWVVKRIKNHISSQHHTYQESGCWSTPRRGWWRKGILLCR